MTTPSFSATLDSFKTLPSYANVDLRELTMDAFDLDRFRHFLDQVGNPEKGLPVIHIAGSKGKGSTAALVASALQALGKRVGVYMSPYIGDPTEAIFVDGQPISRDDFSKIFAKFLPAFESLSSTHFLTAFEMLTAIALQHFHEADVDFAVLETGLGGRLDATNVVESPIVSVITSIEREHEALLGNTLNAIAYEKLGIVREGTPVVIAPQNNPGVMDFSRAFCMNKQAPVIAVSGQYRPTLLTRSHETFQFRLKTPTRTIDSISLGLLGDHQVVNAVTAWAVLDQLLDDFDAEAVCEVWRHLTLPGRFEYVDFHGRLMILDGAHTPSSAAVLRRTLTQIYGEKPIQFLMAFLNDKKVLDCFKALARPQDRVLITQVDHPRALSARESMEAIEDYANAYGISVSMTNNLRIAHQKLSKVPPDMPLCVTGSFKLVELMRNER